LGLLDGQILTELFGNLELKHDESPYLVGGLQYEFDDFPFSNVIITDELTPSFFRVG